MQKRLYRSKKDRVFAGVCGGIGEYMEVDPTLIRLVWVIFCFMGGAGVLAYFISIIIIPENPKQKKPVSRKEEAKELRYHHDEKQGALIAGLVLIIVGSFFLANNFGFFIWFDWTLYWPVLIIAIGLIMIITGSVKK